MASAYQHCQPQARHVPLPQLLRFLVSEPGDGAFSGKDSSAIVAIAASLCT